MSVTFEQRARNWELFSPPARPSRGEVEIYDRLLGELSPADGRAGVLGCTPELRDLLNGRGISYTCIDQSPTIFRSTELLMATDDSGEFACLDWTKLELPDGAGMVLGDGSINMLSEGGQEELIDRIKDEVPVGGLLLFRVHLWGDRRFDDIESLLAHHREHSKGLSTFSALRTDLDMLWIDDETGVVDMGECGKRLAEAYENGLLTEEEWEPFKALLPINDIRLHYTRAEELRERFEPEFELVGEYAADDYPRADLHPVWALRRVAN